ncbi:MAG: metallophosphoesterase family protein [Planctomycetota bacterium]
MRRIAIISDIHSNIPALEAVLADIDSQQVEAIYCLGDVVGYGPDPAVCMAKVMDVVENGRTIMGNHDNAVIHEPIGFNRSARQAAIWTRQTVRAGFLDILGSKRRRWKWLRELPTSMAEEDVLFVHASPRHHLEEYLLEEHIYGVSFTGEDPSLLLEENFALVEHTCFIGHTHRPGVMVDGDYAWISLPDTAYRWTIDERKAIINVGSVGQPRDGDCRASYVVFDGESVVWRRIEYDIEQTRKRIYANDQLDNRLGDRLLEGK